MSRNQSRFGAPTALQIARRWLRTLLLLTLLPQTSHAYRLGDAIDTEILTPKDSSSQHAPKRSQMPIFGVDTTTVLGPITDHKFSMHFEEGFRALPWINTQSFMGAALEKVEVTFVFSRSGGGEIHSLTTRTIYEKDKDPKKGSAATDATKGEIIVEYKWIEEESVDLNGGAFVMFLAIFVSSLFMLVDLCGLCDSGDEEDDYAPHRSYQTATGGSHIPKNE